MKRINSSAVGIQQGNRVLFSDFVDDGPMWTGQGNRDCRVEVRFDHDFTDVPMVHVSIGMWDMDHKHNIRADVSAENVTNTGFDIVFRTWHDTRIARVRADWLAIGATQSDDVWDLY